MQKIILFVEPSDDAWFTPAKIADIFMNRFAVDENASCEILERFELDKTSDKKSRAKFRDNLNFVEEWKKKGMDHSMVNVKILHPKILI